MPVLPPAPPQLRALWLAQAQMYHALRGGCLFGMARPMLFMFQVMGIVDVPCPWPQQLLTRTKKMLV